MEGKKIKPILQTQSGKEEDAASEVRQKRVSFSGKKFVREFQGHVWDSYEVSDRIESSNNSNNKSTLHTESSASSIFLCTTNDYIDKSTQSFVLEASAPDITPTNSEQRRFQDKDKNTKKPKDGTNETPKIIETNKTNLEEEKSKVPTTIQQTSTACQNEDEEELKYIFFNDNSNKENLKPHDALSAGATKSTADTLKIFDDCTLGNKTAALLSESDESIQTRSFRHDLQRISEHVFAATPMELQQGEEMPSTSNKNLCTEREELHQVEIYTKSPRVPVQRFTTPISLSKRIQEQKQKKLQEQQQQSKQQQQQQQQTARNSVNQDIFNDISGITPIDGELCSALLFEETPTSSPILPIEYKNVDLQKLNEVCSSGRLQIFSDKKKFKRKITTPLNFNKTKKDAIAIELENSFWGVNSIGNKPKENIETTSSSKPQVVDNQVENNIFLKNTTNHKHVNKEECLQTSMTIETEMVKTAPKDDISKRQTVVFQNALIDEEKIDEEKIDEEKIENVAVAAVGSKSLYELNDCEISTEETSSAAFEKPQESSIAQNSHPKEDCKSLDMRIEKTILFQNTNIVENQFNEKVTNCTEITFKSSQNTTGENRRGTIFFEDEIEVESQWVAKPAKRSLFKEENSTIDETNVNVLEHARIETRVEQCKNEKVDVQNLAHHHQPTQNRRLTQHFNETVLEEHMETDECVPKDTGAIPKLKFLHITHGNSASIEEMEQQNHLEDQRQSFPLLESLMESSSAKNASKTVEAIAKLQFLQNKPQDSASSAIEQIEKQNKNASNRHTLYFEKSGLIEVEEEEIDENKHENEKLTTNLAAQNVVTNQINQSLEECTSSTPMLESTYMKELNSNFNADFKVVAQPMPPPVSVVSNGNEKFESSEGMEISCVVRSVKPAENQILTSIEPTKNRSTQIFDNDEPMETDDFTFKVPNNLKEKKTPPPRIQNKLQQKTVHFSQSVEFPTPSTFWKNNLKSNKFVPFSPATPHRSLLEFEKLEKELADDDDNYDCSNDVSKFHSSSNAGIEGKEDNINQSPIAVVAIGKNNLKRDTGNLTPNFPHSKKRQSLKCSRLDFTTTSFKINAENITTKFADELTSICCNDESMNDDINRTEPPSGFLYFTPPSPKTKQSPTLLPVYTGAIKKISPARVSSPDTHSIENLHLSSFNCNESISTNNSPKSPSVSSAVISKSTPTPTRLPVYKGAIKKLMSPRDSSVNMQSTAHTDELHSIEEGSHHLTLSQIRYDTKTHNVSKNEFNVTTTPKAEHEALEKRGKEIQRECSEFKELLDVISDPKKREALYLSELEEYDKEVGPIVAAFSTSFASSSSTSYASNNNDKDATLKPEAEVENENVSQQIYELTREECFKQKAFVCRKCVRCQESILKENSMETTTTDSFVMPTMLSISEVVDRLLAPLKRLPKITEQDTVKILRQYNIQSMQNQIEISELKEKFAKLQSKNYDDDSDLEEDYGNAFIKARKDAKRRSQTSDEIKNKPYSEFFLTFVEKLEHLMKQTTARNWICNFKWRAVKILRFRHKTCLAFIIVLQYEDRTRFGEEITIKKIELYESTINNATLCPISYIRLYQIKLKLYSLASLCLGDTAQDVFEMLQKVDKICMEAKDMSNDLWEVVAENRATFVRNNKRNYVSKIARKDIYDGEGFYVDTITTEFKIEITDLRKLSYKNIITPALFNFKENVAELPTGVDFLKHFLKDPASYLWNNE